MAFSLFCESSFKCKLGSVLEQSPGSLGWGLICMWIFSITASSLCHKPQSNTSTVPTDFRLRCTQQTVNFLQRQVALSTSRLGWELRASYWVSRLSILGGTPKPCPFLSHLHPSGTKGGAEGRLLALWAWYYISTVSWNLHRNLESWHISSCKNWRHTACSRSTGITKSNAIQSVWLQTLQAFLSLQKALPSTGPWGLPINVFWTVLVPLFMRCIISNISKTTSREEKLWCFIGFLKTCDL